MVLIMKKFSSILCFVLVLSTIMMGISTIAYAEPAGTVDLYNTYIVEDSVQQRIVTTSDFKNIYTSIIDKTSNTIQMKVTNIETGEVAIGDKVSNSNST